MTNSINKQATRSQLPETRDYFLKISLYPVKCQWLGSGSEVRKQKSGSVLYLPDLECVFIR